MAQPSSAIQFRWDNSYAERLPAGFYVSCDPAVFPNPVLLRFNGPLAEELGLNGGKLDAGLAAKIFSGTELPAGAQPLAQAYAGHQFGGFVPQLGDGRALLLGEVVDCHGRRRDIALKGSGPTPFSRGGDGKAAVGPVLREYLIGEAMHALGVPTTRALAAVGTGETVMRERQLPGAILTRVAASHIRVGTFEYFAARRQDDQLRILADFVIDRHDPNLAGEADRYLLLLKAVAERQAALLAKWMLVGFIHGVMNTDNMAVSGETIDYGPCAFMESYSPDAVFSSIDSGGRYAYGNQPTIARWNLARFAETLLSLIDDKVPDHAMAEATDVINGFIPRHEALWLTGARAKLGLTTAVADDDGDRVLAIDWLGLLEQHSVDFTLGWRRLADAAEGIPELLEVLFPSPDALRPWLERWQHRLAKEPTAATAEAMRAVNPIYIPRNHLVEEALTRASDDADLTPFERLLDVLADPFVERPGLEDYAQPAPFEFTACYRTFCGT
jgi:uncharacterized protein YdiU (UPF0061 family)